MKTNLNQSKPIFFKSQLVKFVKWESLNFYGKIKIKLNSKFIEVHINDLKN